VYARHLKFLFIRDIDPSLPEMTDELAAEFNLQKQLIGYIGGEAGTGKSAFIAAILTFATLWGRRNTVETMAFTGLAALNVQGDTIHSHRGITITMQYKR